MPDEGRGKRQRVDDCSDKAQSLLPRERVERATRAGQLGLGNRRIGDKASKQALRCSRRVELRGVSRDRPAGKQLALVRDFVFRKIHDIAPENY